MIGRFAKLLISNKVNLILFSMLLIGVTGFSTLYLASERSIKFWDFLLYPDLTFALFDEFQKSPILGIQSLLQSLSDDYNKLFCLPILPWIFLLGKTRFVYILALNVSYLIPFCLSIGKLATATLRPTPSLPIPSLPIPSLQRESRTLFWTAVFLSVAIPSVWLPGLWGYPDIGGMTFIAYAAIVYLKDPDLKQWRQILLIGLCLAIAFLFRRHLVYNGIAFLVALGFQSIMTILSDRSQIRDRLLRKLGRIAAIPMISFAIVAAIAPQLVHRISTQDYGHLYSSYELSSSDGLRLCVSSYGVVILALAVAGLGIGFARRVFPRPSILFMSAYGFFAYAIWILKVRYGAAPHYNLHFAIPIILGVVALVWGLKTVLPVQRSRIAIAMTLIVLGVNSAIALFPTPLSHSSSRHPIVLSYRMIDVAGEGYFPISLFSTSIPPDYRRDYDELLRLVDYLHSQVSRSTWIYVASSSLTLNESLLVEAERQRYGKENIRFELTPTAIVDSRDFYPLASLMQASYVVIATPFQHTLISREQEVVKVVVDAFTESWTFANDFEALPAEFELQNQVKVRLYRRVRPTSWETALTTLEQMKQAMDKAPGSDMNWFPLQMQPLPVAGTMNGIRFLPRLTQRGVQQSFVYYGQVPEQADFRGKVGSRGCAQVEMKLSALPSGKMLSVQKLNLLPGQSVDFSKVVATQGAKYLRLDAVTKQGQGCPVDQNEGEIVLNDIAIADVNS